MLINGAACTCANTGTILSGGKLLLSGGKYSSSENSQHVSWILSPYAFHV